MRAALTSRREPVARLAPPQLRDASNLSSLIEAPGWESALEFACESYLGARWARLASC